jgi:hypothetical protein
MGLELGLLPEEVEAAMIGPPWHDYSEFETTKRGDALRSAR